MCLFSFFIHEIWWNSLKPFWNSISDIVFENNDWHCDSLCKQKHEKLISWAAHCMFSRKANSKFAWIFDKLQQVVIVYLLCIFQKKNRENSGYIFRVFLLKHVVSRSFEALNDWTSITLYVKLLLTAKLIFYDFT